MEATGVVPQLLTAEDVGRLLQRHPRIVRELAEKGELPHVRLGRRGIRFDPDDVRAYIDRHRIPDSAYDEIADVLVEEANRRRST